MTKPYAVRAQNTGPTTGRATLAVLFPAGTPDPERRYVIRTVAWGLRQWRFNVCDGAPGWMWPGDYLTCWVGPWDWLGAGHGGYCPYSLSRAKNPTTRTWDRERRYEVYVRQPSPVGIIHETGHLLDNGHAPSGIMGRPASLVLFTPAQVTTGNRVIIPFCDRTPAENSFAHRCYDEFAVDEFDWAKMNPYQQAGRQPAMTDLLACGSCVDSGVMV